MLKTLSIENIAVIEKDGKFKYCPIFDQGAGLLSNMMYCLMHIIPIDRQKILIFRQKTHVFQLLNRAHQCLRRIF